jgi:HAD superfamily hydrolase (TIGR01662 family)
MIKCVLFDRDGTLGELGDKRFPQTFVPFSDIQAIFHKLKENGYLVGIITNQSSIARGTAKNYDYNAEFESYGADIWEICPHDDEDKCECRKPKSGLLLRVCKKLNLSPFECLIVGDRLSDIQCAKNVGANAVLVLTGYGKNELTKVKALYPDTTILNQFDEIINILKA